MKPALEMGSWQGLEELDEHDGKSQQFLEQTASEQDLLTNLLVRDPNELSSIIGNLNGLGEYINHHEQTISRNMKPEAVAGVASEAEKHFNGYE